MQLFDCTSYFSIKLNRKKIIAMYIARKNSLLQILTKPSQLPGTLSKLGTAFTEMLKAVPVLVCRPYCTKRNREPLDVTEALTSQSLRAGEKFARVRFDRQK